MKASKVASARKVIDELVLPPSAWKRVPGGPDEQLDAALRQWLACGIDANDRKVEIALPSDEVDVLWCGFIMSTARYGRFSRTAYTAFLHRRSRREELVRKDGSRVFVASTGALGQGLTQLPEPGSTARALANTDDAWEKVARRGETRLF